MTSTIPLQVKTGLVALIEANSAIHRAYLNRDQPIGENETERGPIAIVRQVAVRSTTDNQMTLPLTMQIRVSVYVQTQALGPSVDEITDPIWQAINGIMHGASRALPGVQGVQFLAHELEPEGDAGRMDLFYNFMLRVYQHDLTQPTS